MTQTNELITGPRDLLVVSLVAAGVGFLSFLLSNLIMKAIGLDINEYARETERYRYMSFFDQMTAFLADLRNVPVLIGVMGLFLICVAGLMALGSGVWFLIRIVEARI